MSREYDWGEEARLIRMLRGENTQGWNSPEMNDLMDKIKAQFPKRHKRNAAICPLTGEKTYNSHGISSRALRVYERGVKATLVTEHAVEQKGGLKRYAWDHSWGHFSYVRGPEGQSYKGNGSFTMFDLPEEMLKGWDICCGSSYVLYHSSLEEEHIKAVRLDTPDPRKRDRLTFAIMTPDQAAALHRAVTLTMWMRQQEKDESFANGRNLLMGLSSGDVKIEDYDATAAENTMNIQRRGAGSG